MFNYRSKAILKREIKTQIFSKKFIIMTLSLPIFMAVMFGLQYIFVTFDREEKSLLHILHESEDFQALIQQQIAGTELDNPALYELQFALIEPDAIESYVEERRPALLDGSITGIVFIPDSAREDKRIHYYSTNPNNQILQGRLREQVNRAVVGEYFDKLNVGAEAIAYARSNVDVQGIRVTSEGNTGADFDNMILAFGLSFLIYISLFSAGPAVMAAVNEEKTNRVVEVLLSAVTTRELVYGKIIGTALTGLVQMAIWISPVLIISLLSLPALAMLDTFDFNLSLLEVLYFLVNYFFGVICFMGFFAAFGAMFDNPQDAQGAMMPVFMLIMVPFFMVFTLVQNPANILAEVGSMLPFFNIMIMPARMVLIDVPLWQLGIAILVNIATLWLCIRFGAKLYRITILMTGKKPGWKEIYKWLRYE